MKERLLKPSRIALLLALASAPLHQLQAQDAEETAEQSTLITVTATRNPIPAFDYPGQVSVVERETIEDFNPSTLQEVFQAIPGAEFDAGPRRTGDAPSIRGIGGNGVLIFQDGARQSFVSGHDGRFFIDPELVQTLEVVRGPSSALYGSGALGGVIATRTVSASDLLDEGERTFVKLATGYQSVNDEFRIGATAAAQSSDAMWDVLGHLTYRDAGSIKLGSGDTLPADDEITSSLFKVTLRPSDAVELYASYARYQADSSDPQNPQGANIAGAANDLVFRDARNDTAQMGLNFNPASDAIDLNLVGYYSKNGVEEDTVGTSRIADREVETFGLTIDNRSRIGVGDGSSLTFTYGGEYYRDEQTGLDTDTADGTRGGVPDAQTEFLGAFLQAELTLTDGLPGEISIIPGIRWDSFKSSATGEIFTIDDDEFSPKLGVSYKPIPELLLFGNWSRGFRAPSFNEAFADGVHFTIPDLSAAPGPFGPSFVQNLFIGNEALVPEQSESWEAGAGVNFADLITDGDRLTFKASYYDSDVENLIGLDVNIPTGCFVASPFVPSCGTGAAFGNTSQNVNIADAQISGVEAEFNYSSDHFYLRGNFSTIDGVDAATGEFLEGVLSPSVLFLDTGLRLRDGDVRVGTRVTSASDFDEVNDPNQAREGYLVADLYLVIEPETGPLEGFRLDLGIDNIGDADFEVVSAGVSQPGRNVKAALSWSKGF
ncbi:TonB-dependent receptor [Erythrobacter sp. SCSIO 43205]|uniref:TonB-dependent receptor domain-containing protein n=1 Tax=Erythrobacter sp. SCSIO 43205 TaxID=2779361 RepID=UPI001CAA2147|nr:TonB-dependent receptor [Erythrobacter sp. SCSIO 43205]UAB77928.1 TonB-dependent receptor [Erythrobacter sp. SCSIO 43205]